jgi:hypothetical protein
MPPALITPLKTLPEKPASSTTTTPETTELTAYREPKNPDTEAEEFTIMRLRTPPKLITDADVFTNSIEIPRGAVALKNTT